MKTVTILEFSPEDFDKAAEIARKQGYRDNTAYESSSDLFGLHMLALHAGMPDKTICKTKEFGFVVMQVIED